MEQLNLMEQAELQPDTLTPAVEGPPAALKENTLRFVAIRPAQRTAYDVLKRGFDIVASLLALLVLGIPMLVVALLVRIDSKGPALYLSERCGKDGKTFRMYKFRSMCLDADKLLHTLQEKNEADGPVFKIAKDPRVTKFGNFIRKFSIDELPQLINILKGDMTVVGPRPPLPHEVEKYTPYQMQRLQVTPGLTCYWQCSGRSNLSFEDWVELDLKYIQDRSLLTDMKIIFRTVPAVFSGKGAY